jgi:hypothetical protein
MTTRTLVIGDWNRIVRGPIDVLRTAFFAGAAAFALLGELGGVANVVHFIVPMLCAQVAYIALARIEVLPDMREDFTAHRYTGIFTVTLALGVAIGGIWEILEWSSDSLFGSSLQLSNDDTVGDLISDTLGAVAGGLLLVAWTKYGWGSVRRVPGENRREDVDA